MLKIKIIPARQLNNILIIHPVKPNNFTCLVFKFRSYNKFVENFIINLNFSKVN